MFRRANTPRLVAVLAVVVATLALLVTVIAQKQGTPKPQDKFLLGEAEVKQLLLLMDTDKNGKISKQEWMSYMELEFDRLDKNKTGELDVNELAQSTLRVSHFTTAGKWGWRSA